MCVLSLIRVSLANTLLSATSSVELRQQPSSQPASSASDVLFLPFDRDARGMTPFMLAVSGRAYPAAITVLEAAQKIAKGELMAVNL